MKLLYEKAERKMLVKLTSENLSEKSRDPREIFDVGRFQLRRNLLTFKMSKYHVKILIFGLFAE